MHVDYMIDGMDVLKREFLELLDKDFEFRYAVAGYLGLSEILKRLDSLIEEQTKIWEEIRGLRVEQTKIWEEIRGLRVEFNRAFSALDVRLRRVERTLEKLTVDVEDEARSIIEHRLRQELGLMVEVDSLSLPDLEINIYGVSGDVCIVGEATVRAGAKIIAELSRKIEVLRRKYPDRLRKKLIPCYLCVHTST